MEGYRYGKPVPEEYRCVCAGPEVRCTDRWTNETDKLCDACRHDRDRREH